MTVRGDCWEGAGPASHSNAPRCGRVFLLSNSPIPTTGVSMTNSEAVPRDLLLECVRHLRFGGFARRCVRCQHPRVIRWGSFSGRQRYRCGGCRRTFSDLTASPFAGSKRVGSLPAILAELEDASSLRVVSCAAGVHASTSFRWRHRMLKLLSAGASPSLGSKAVLHRHPMPFVATAGARSDGTISSRRYPPPPGRHRKGHFWIAGIVGRGSRSPETFLSPIGTDRRAWPGGESGSPVRVSCSKARLWTREGRFGPTAQRARLRGIVHLTHGPTGDRNSTGALPAGPRHLTQDFETAKNACTGFRSWIGRFRGISARYVGHYLRWYSLWRRGGYRSHPSEFAARRIPFRKGIRLLSVALEVSMAP
jgi:transposase-like protein